MSRRITGRAGRSRAATLWTTGLRAPVVALTALLAILPGAPAAAAAVSVELDRDEVANRLGDRFRFESTVRNDGDQPVTGLIAHLNILSSDPDVYVDPEDWSPRRTQYLDPLPPGGAADLVWEVQSVNSGPLVLYVAVSGPGADAVSASRPLDLTVESRRTLDAGGFLPVAAGVPASVLILIGASIARRRRAR